MQDDDARILCNRCEGCGKTCDPPRSSEKPWSHLAGSDDETLFVEVDDKKVYPETCGDCNGIGQKRAKAQPADIDF